MPSAYRRVDGRPVTLGTFTVRSVAAHAAAGGLTGYGPREKVGGGGASSARPPQHDQLDRME
jgi:hypothetical protein